MRSKNIMALALAATITFCGCGAYNDGQMENAELYGQTGQTQSEEAENNIITEQTENNGQEEQLQSTQEEQEQAEQPETTDGVEEQDETEEQVAYASYIKVTGTNVNIRSGAGTNYTVLGTAEQNTLYANFGLSGGWYKTQYQNNAAYISSAYCEIVEIEASQSGLVESVIAEGLKLLGTEYVYGAVRYHDGTGKLNSGFTVTEFDCSSLTQYIFYKGAGVLLQVNTRTQIYQGEHVEQSDLRRGDLMFFTNDSRYNNTGIECVGHVAVYLGDNYILHTSSDYAKVEQLTTKRWNYFLEARRMV